MLLRHGEKLTGGVDGARLELVEPFPVTGELGEGAHHVLRHAVLPGDRGAGTLDFYGIQLDARGGEHSLEPGVELLEHGVVVGIRPLGLVDDEEDVGAVPVGAGLDVAAGEEAVPQVVGELHRLLQSASLVRVHVDHQKRQAGLAPPVSLAREVDRLGLEDGFGADAESPRYALEMADYEGLGEAVEPDAGRLPPLGILRLPTRSRVPHVGRSGVGDRGSLPGCRFDGFRELPVGTGGVAGDVALFRNVFHRMAHVGLIEGVSQDDRLGEQVQGRREVVCRLVAEAIGVEVDQVRLQPGVRDVLKSLQEIELGRDDPTAAVPAFREERFLGHGGQRCLLRNFPAVRTRFPGIDGDDRGLRREVGQESRGPSRGRADFHDEPNRRRHRPRKELLGGGRGAVAVGKGRHVGLLQRPGVLAGEVGQQRRAFRGGLRGPPGPSPKLSVNEPKRGRSMPASSQL